MIVMAGCQSTDMGEQPRRRDKFVLAQIVDQRAFESCLIIDLSMKLRMFCRVNSFRIIFDLTAQDVRAPTFSVSKANLHFILSGISRPLGG